MDAMASDDAVADEMAMDEMAMDETGMDDAAMDDAAMAEMAADHEHHHGDGLPVPADMATPQVGISVVPDAMSGVNLTVDVTDFTIAPREASLESRNGEGHMHLYVDGERVMRFYNEALHLELSPGEHTVMVELSANDHQPWTVDGEAITASQTVTVAESAGHHMHGDDGVEVAENPAWGMGVLADPKSGWNVEIELDGFELSAAAVNTDPVDGQGHLHLYVNDRKITRLYGEWWHLAELPAGENEIRVSMHGNDHAPLLFQGEPLELMVPVTISEADGSPVWVEEADDLAEEEMVMAAGDAGEPSADVSIAGEYRAGEIILADDRFEVSRGDFVEIRMISDVAEEVHVHGFDYHLDLVPGEEASLIFEATIPGLFEVELEDSHKFLFELAVS